MWSATWLYFPPCPASNYLLRLQISFAGYYSQGRKKKKPVWNFIISFSSFSNCDHTLEAPSWADVWESVTMELFLSSKDDFIACSVIVKEKWLKLNLKKILINNRNGEKFFKSNTWWSIMHFYGLPCSPNIAFVYLLIYLFGFLFL